VEGPGGGCFFTGDADRYVKKVSGCRASLSIGAPLRPMGTWNLDGGGGGGSYTGDFER
jgi:hypothetical protein